MSALPKSIRVGHLDYRVEDWLPSEAYANNRSGECDKIHLVIRVRADLPPARKAEVLLHEVLHAVWEMGDLAGSGDTEEKVITVMGTLMTTIWRDNPNLIAFMETSLGRGRGE